MVDPIEAVVDSELLVQQLLDLFAPDPAAAARILLLFDGTAHRFLLLFAEPGWPPALRSPPDKRSIPSVTNQSAHRITAWRVTLKLCATAT